MSYYFWQYNYERTLFLSDYVATQYIRDSLNYSLPKGSLKIIESIYGRIFSLVVCPEGSYLNSQDSGACTICPVNTYSTTTDSNMCSNCPLGTNTQELTGRTSSNACGKRMIIFKYDSNRNVYYINLPVYCEIP